MRTDKPSVKGTNAGAIQVIPLKRIVPNPFNPRRTFDPDELQDLAESIKRHGLLQPVVVRLVPGNRNYQLQHIEGTKAYRVHLSGNGVSYEVASKSLAEELQETLWSEHYELIAGERRLRACGLAKATEVAANVVVMSDEEASDAAMVENEKRLAVQPLERADGYARAMERFGRSVEQIATRIGQSTGTVYGLLKLRNLPEGAKEALRRGDLPETTAKLIARLPTEETREEATKRILFGDQGGVMSFRAAKEYIDATFTRELKAAVFDRQALDLVEAAGACGPCPKRLGNMGEANGRADVCTDVACFRAKELAHEKKLLDHALKRQGIPALRDPGAKKWFDASGRLDPSRHWIDLDDTFDGGGRGKKKTYRQLVGKECIEGERAERNSSLNGYPPVAMAVVDPKGALRTLAPAGRVEALLKKKGLLKDDQHFGHFGQVTTDVPYTPPAEPDEVPAYKIAEEAGFELARQVATRVNSVAKMGLAPIRDVIENATWALAVATHGMVNERIVERRLEESTWAEMDMPEDEFFRMKVKMWLQGAPESEVLALLIELVAADACNQYSSHHGEVRDRFAEGVLTTWSKLHAGAEKELTKKRGKAKAVQPATVPDDDDDEEEDDEEDAEGEAEPIETLGITEDQIKGSSIVMKLSAGKLTKAVAVVPVEIDDRLWVAAGGLYDGRGNHFSKLLPLYPVTEFEEKFLEYPTRYYPSGPPGEFYTGVVVKVRGGEFAIAPKEELRRVVYHDHDLARRADAARKGRKKEMAR